MVACPYCERVYTNRRIVAQHLEKTHPIECSNDTVDNFDKNTKRRMIEISNRILKNQNALKVNQIHDKYTLAKK